MDIEYYIVVWTADGYGGIIVDQHTQCTWRGGGGIKRTFWRREGWKIEGRGSRMQSHLLGRRIIVHSYTFQPASRTTTTTTITTVTTIYRGCGDRAPATTSPSVYHRSPARNFSQSTVLSGRRRYRFTPPPCRRIVSCACTTVIHSSSSQSRSVQRFVAIV